MDSKWEFYDLSCVSRDDTEDKVVVPPPNAVNKASEIRTHRFARCQQVLFDAVEAGARIGAIFKEPTVTPSAIQKVIIGLEQPRVTKNTPPLISNTYPPGKARPQESLGEPKWCHASWLERDHDLSRHYPYRWDDSGL